jgi:hypothetical protein
MTMMISADTKIAIVQFGHKKNEEELQKITRQLAREELAHWYYFDETADEEFELEQLCEHYRIVFKCYESKYMERVK